MSQGNEITELDSPKAFHVSDEKDLLLGVCGKLHGLNRLFVSNEMLHELVPLDDEGKGIGDPVIAKAKDVDKKWILTHFTENLKFELEQTMVGESNKDFQDMGYGNIVLGIFNGKMFMTDSFGTPIFTSRSVLSAGSGSPYALGSMHTTEKSRMSIEKRLRKALETAAHFDSGTGGKFYMISSEDLEVKEI